MQSESAESALQILQLQRVNLLIADDVGIGQAGAALYAIGEQVVALGALLESRNGETSRRRAARRLR